MSSHPAIAASFALGAPITGLALNRAGTHLAAATGEGKLFWLPLGSADLSAPQDIHDGPSLCLKPGVDDLGILSGGDDGALIAATPEAAPRTLFRQPGRWIEHLDAHPRGVIALSAGKQVHRLNGAGAPLGAPLPHPSTPGGLALNAKGKRLAVAHYNGVSVWWMNAEEPAPQLLEWAGVHLAAIWHPKEDIVLTAQQDMQLHGWRLADMAQMRMQGYVTKVLSLGWSAKAKYLVSSGAEQPICWPFFGGGPWNKPPLQPGTPRDIPVSCVAAHPADALVAAAHADGLIQLCALEPLPGFMIAPPTGSAGTALQWSADGRILYAGDEAGTLSVFTAESVRAGTPLVG